MKKIIALIAAIGLATTASAQAIYNPGEHDNQVSIFAEDAEDLEEYPLELQLTNPTVGIGGVSAYLYFDDNDVKPWIWDEDEQAYYYDTNSKRCYKSVKVEVFLTDKTNERFPEYLFVNALDTKDFKLTEGTIMTLYIDATKLGNGIHTLHVVEPMCSYANADGSESASYICRDQTIDIMVTGGTLTVMDIPTIQHPNGVTTLYDLQGRSVDTMKHGVYIKNGRKVIK